MANVNLISLILMSLLYIMAGISHFRNPKFFLKITPLWVPSPETVNLLVGMIEIILGVCVLIPLLRIYAAWGIICLLIAVFPANVYHFQKALKKKKQIWITLIRLPIQILLIWWAFSFT